MYEFIRGTLVEATPLFAVLDVQGVGYKLFIPFSHYGKMAAPGTAVRLFTSWIVRETSQTLYGFLEKSERDFFEVLLSLPGIGPKTAMGIVGHITLKDLAEVVQNHDIATLSKVPGIGKKTAERLIVDLKGKIPAFASSVEASQMQTGASQEMRDALGALINLGYTQVTAQQALKKAMKELPEQADLAMLITAALKKM